MNSRSRINCCNILFLSSLTLFFLTPHQSHSTTTTTTDRQTLEIIIGGGGGGGGGGEYSPPSPPPDYVNCPNCPLPPAISPVCPEPIPPPPPPPVNCPSPPPPPLLSPPPPPSPPPPTPKPSPPPPPENNGDLSAELRRAAAVIARFKKTITSDPLGVTKTWKGRICSDPGSYRGFTCDVTTRDNKTRVALVNFNGFNLGGNNLALSDFLDALTDIIVFHANTNNFVGKVPSAIKSLFELDLSNNKLGGQFPAAVLTSRNLTFLDLRFNGLAGKIPPEAFTLDLDVLYLNNNNFSGKIPESVGKTPALYLTLANNELTGSIPKSIGQASNTLLEALLSNNRFSGCLPYEIGLLKKATFFDVSVNGLTGPIPHSFGCLKSMRYLDLSYNELYGTVPESLCEVRSLVELTLKNNYFTQVGPECRKLIASKKLDVRTNCILDLPGQRSSGECQAFFLRQKSCPDPNSMNVVPCKIDRSGSAGKKGRKLLGRPRTYAALEKKHL